MRWKAEAAKPEPKHGDERAVTRFLWRPLLMGDEWRWLERAAIIQCYRSVPLAPSYSSWKDKRWAKWPGDYAKWPPPRRI
jgi:hypothetical protein